jgi:hypothetical protein
MSVPRGGTIARDYVRRYARRRIAANLARTVGGPQFQRGYEHAFRELLEWLNQQPKRTGGREASVGDEGLCYQGK